jgi:hypothetical protein
MDRAPASEDVERGRHPKRPDLHPRRWNCIRYWRLSQRREDPCHLTPIGAVRRLPSQQCAHAVQFLQVVESSRAHLSVLASGTSITTTSPNSKSAVSWFW